MTCEEFQALRYEYVDATLSADQAAEARRHLQHCVACTQELEREQRLQQALHMGLTAATAGLALDRSLTNRIVTAAIPRPEHRWLGWLGRHRLPSVAVLGASLIAALMVVLHRVGTTQRPAILSQAPVVVFVDIPYAVNRHVTYIRDGAVVDALITQSVECRGSL